MINSKAYQDRVLQCRWIPKPLNASRLFKQWNGGQYGYRQKGMVGAVYGQRTGAFPIQLGVDQLNGPPLAFLEKKLTALRQPKTREELQRDGRLSALKVFTLFECPFELGTSLHQVCLELSRRGHLFIQKPLPFFFSAEGIKGEEPAIFMHVDGLAYRFSFWDGLFNGLEVVDLHLVYQNSSQDCLPPFQDVIHHPFELGINWFKIA
jgi:hypothetical protein